MSAAAVTIGCERYPCREWERRTERVTAQSDLSDILEREHTVSFTTHQHAKNSHTKHNHTEHTTYKLNYEQATENWKFHAKFVPGHRNGRSGTSQHGPGQAPFGILVSVANPTFSLTGVSLKEIEHPISHIRQNCDFASTCRQESSARVHS